jgi:S1-C subfamily serine protease
MRAGDVLVESGGRPLRTFLDWEAVKLDIGPGDTVPVRVARNGRARDVRLLVEDLPTASAEKVDILGLQLVTLTPAIRQERGVRSEQGALIYEIPETTARQTGLQAGDVIRQINQVGVTSADDVERLIRAARGRGAIRVYFERGGRGGFSDFYVQ